MFIGAKFEINPLVDPDEEGDDIEPFMILKIEANGKEFTEIVLDNVGYPIEFSVDREHCDTIIKSINLDYLFK